MDEGVTLDGGNIGKLIRPRVEAMMSLGRHFLSTLDHTKSLEAAGWSEIMIKRVVYRRRPGKAALA